MKKLLLFGALALSINTFAQVPNYVPTSNLIAWYGFNGNTNDESINTNDGTVNGATLTTDRFGAANSCYQFDGVDDYIQISNVLLPGVSTSFSISYWINPSSLPTGGAVVVSDRYGADCGYKYSSSYNNTGNCQVGTHITSPWTANSAGTVNSINPSNWIHIVGVYNNNSQVLEIYQNGQLEGSTTSSIWNTSSNPTTIGAYDGCGIPIANFFDGLIDDIGFWDRDLNQCEIIDLFTAGNLAGASQSNSVLTADQTGATYQWLDCDDNNAIINGETNQSYTPAVTGNYAVEVTLNGCVDTSACFLVDYTGIEELTKGTKDLVKVVDLMGRETTPQKNRVLIYIYSDGTTERIFEFE